MTGTEPNRYDPTEEDLAAARALLADVEPADLMRKTFAAIAGRLDALGHAPADLADSAIREARAALAAYDERRQAVRS